MVCTERKKGKTLTSGRKYGVEIDMIRELTVEHEGWRLESPIPELNYGDRGWPYRHRPCTMGALLLL